MLRHIAYTMILLCFAACSPPGTSHPDMVHLLLPQGDAAAGARAFSDLGCVTCHKLSAGPSLSAPVADRPGPELGDSALAGLSRGAIATALIAPAHVNAEDHELWTDRGEHQSVWLGPGQQPPDQTPPRHVSRMRDYRNVMTVQQLCDLIALLQNSDEPN